jgi:hypothetical protein
VGKEEREISGGESSMEIWILPFVHEFTAKMETSTQTK